MIQRITFSADAEQIEKLRALARQEGTTVNKLFREWLEDEMAKSIDNSQVRLDRKYTREEMNER